MSASEQLGRLLYIIAAASREGGIALDELAQALSVEVRTVLADIEKATAREFDHPAGTAEPFTISIRRDRVRVTANREFKRPVRLNAREALALGLGLRMLAAEADAQRRAGILGFAERIERELLVPDVELQPRVQTSREAPGILDAAQVEEFGVQLGQDDFRGIIAQALQEHRLVAIEYLKAGDVASEQRHIVPRQLMYADGRWYIAAYDIERRDTRRFRMDRTLRVELLEQRLEDDALPEQHFQPYEAEEDADDQVVVRYSARIARWIAEYADAEPAADGSVRVRHSVADPRWLVRHVLQHGGEAVVETETYRGLVARAVARLTA